MEWCGERSPQRYPIAQFWRCITDADRNGMEKARIRSVLPLAALAVASLVLAFANGSTGDYPTDAGPTIDALLHGDLHRALASQPIMGAFAVLVRLPFAALAKALGGGELAVYRLGSLPCLLALGLLGLALAREMLKRGVPEIAAGA